MKRRGIIMHSRRSAMNNNIGRKHSLLAFLSALCFLVIIPLANTPTMRAAPTTATTYTTSDTNDGTGSCDPTSHVCTTLRAAIAAANSNPGSTVDLAAGATYMLTYTLGGGLRITSDMTINGCTGGGCSPATVRGSNSWADDVFSISSSPSSGPKVAMNNLIIRKGSNSSGGGGIDDQGNLTMTNCTVENNTAVPTGLSFGYGGGISVDSGASLTLNSCTIQHNNAQNTRTGGGGIYVSAGAALTVTDSSVRYNDANGNGGGILALSPVTITNSHVFSNTALWDGGGIFSQSGMSITGGSVISNTADITSPLSGGGYGGGICVSGSTLPIGINGTTISNNSSGMDGAGIYVSGQYGTNSLSLVDVAVKGNQALGDTGVNTSGGGLVYSVPAGMCSIATSTISGNSSTFSGGGVYVSASGLNVTASTVTNNSSGLVGGGLYINATTATISHSAISANTLSADDSGGGGIEVMKGALTVTGSTISGHNLTSTDSHGGGIDEAPGAVITVTGSTISGNQANWGAGLEIAGLFTATNSTVSDNQVNISSGIGGGLRVSPGGQALLTNVTLTANRGGHAGGAVYGSATVHNTLLAGNTADTFGPDCDGTLTSQGYNLLGTPDNCTGLTNGTGGNQVGTHGSPLDAKLGPLADNGGTTLTHALLVGSPAIDAGDPSYCLASDQRGMRRPFGSGCDIGAYEYGFYLYLPLVIRH
jgi:fibronectin-binding autotransporter adhesin